MRAFPQVNHSLAPIDDAPQHRPRPLPLFLDLLRSETAAKPDRMQAALRGLRRYQSAARLPAPTPAPVVAQIGRASLRDYGDPAAPPILFVPSLINPPDILDLGPDRSLLRWLAGQGFRPLLLDWGTPGADDRQLSIADHVERLLLPLLATLDRPPALVGYCLGGTMALAAAALAGGDVAALALVAAPWRFAGFPPAARAAMAGLWAQSQGPADRLGRLPMEALQAGFWQLDPARLITKYEALGGDPAPAGDALARFVRLEDWANDGPPLPYAAAAEAFDGFFRDDLPGSGRWRVAGRAIDPADIACPVLDIRSSVDRIVPAATAAALPGWSALELDLGHVGMIVGSRAPDALWKPLAGWLAAAIPRC